MGSGDSPADPLLRLRTSILDGARTCCVARVIRYHVDPPTADVELLVRRSRHVDGLRVGEPPVVVTGAPVVWPGSGARSLQMGIEPGDLVVAMYRDGCHAEIDAGATSPVLPAAGLSTNDADILILPGFVPPSAAPDDRGRVDGQPVLRLPTGEGLIIGGDTYFIVREDLLLTWLGSLRTWAMTHVHSGVTAGAGVSGVSTVQPPITPSTGSISTGRILVDE